MEFEKFLAQVREVLTEFKERYEQAEKTPENISKFKFEYYTLRKEIINKFYMQKTKELFTVLEEFETEAAKQEKQLSLMFSGKIVNALGRARSNGIYDALNSVLKIGSVNIFTQENKAIGVGAAKLFRYAVAEFTKYNKQHAKENELTCRVFLNVVDFAAANAVDTNSINAMKNFRRKLSKNLEALRLAGGTWTEKIQGKESTFVGLNLIGKYELNGNLLVIEFSVSVAEYLTSLPLINYPRSLYKIDDREFNTFSIGEDMCIHYSQDNNVIKNTEGKLTVKTLLKHTSFPKYDQLKQHKWSWEEKVKEPFEKALDKLTQCGFIKNWKYCYKGGVEIPDDEMRNKQFNYMEFLSLVVKYEINDFESPEIRKIKIVKKKAEQKKKLQAKRKKTAANKRQNDSGVG